MAILTLSDLLAAIDAMSGRDDQASGLGATYVAMAEARISRAYRARRMVAYAEAEISDATSAVPDDFLGVVSFSLTGSPPVQLRYMSPGQMALADTGTAGKPAFYSIRGSEFQYLPAPDAAYTAALTYHARVPALSEAAPSNWLLLAAPDLYLMGALAEYGAQSEDERAPLWEQRFQQALAELQASDLMDAQGAELTPYPGFTP